MGLMEGSRFSYRFLERARRWCAGTMVRWSATAVLCCIVVGSVAAQSGPGGVGSVQARRQFSTLAEMIERFQTDANVRRRWEVVAGQVFEGESLILGGDRDPVDVVLRRTEALLKHIESMAGARGLSVEETRLRGLKKDNARIGVEDADGRYRLFEQTLRLRRRIAFSNPLLDFDKILFLKRHFLSAEMTRGNHMCDQYFGFNAVAGGGVYVLEDAFAETPSERDVLADSVCENGRFKDKKLRPGGFLSPELSYDGREILFAYTEGEATPFVWTEKSTYHIFKVNVDGSGLVQLTDGVVNDFDPCRLPNGRIAFISERRGGYGRCHPRPVPLYTLHSMNADGGDIVRLSHHESNEWHPSVNRDGMIVYTRWDYTDRGNIQAHHPWITTPDGRDARAIQGNFGKSKQARPLMEMDVKAIPGSHKYIATAAAHHSQAYGSLVLIDPRIEDDDAMSAVRRLTPEAPFPEAEVGWNDGQLYATAWPLSEYFYLCVYDAEGSGRRGTSNNYGIYLVDAFGNKELIYRDPAISCLSPIPLRERRAEPVLAEAMGGSEEPEETETATVGVVNVYNSLKPFPEGTTIKALRIIQVLPKTTPLINEPRIGYGNEKGARAVLGTVPVEADGSAYFELPAGKLVYFQVLDERGLAVQSMRSDTYVHSGERLVCRGCHEPRHSSGGVRDGFAAAFRRAPSKIRPGVEGSNPFSFPRLVQPVLERNCVACHEKESEAVDLRKGDWANESDYRYTSYRNLREYAFFYGATRNKYDPWTTPRTTPGEFGARGSKLYGILAAEHYGVELSKADFHRITLWLDCNSDFFGAYEDTKAQARGEVVRPALE
ncbi:MAG: hypothetical protein ISS79_12530 [Phycisphaerae bacterium]|nr:hypothetical protein [Phycisphaerae bacterium]